MSYQDMTRPGKDLTTGDQIANGAIELRHLSAALFAMFRQLNLHTHSGVNSAKIKHQDLDGAYTQDGILTRSPNGSHWRIKVSNTGVLSAEAV